MNVLYETMSLLVTKSYKILIVIANIEFSYFVRVDVDGG